MLGAGALGRPRVMVWGGRRVQDGEHTFWREGSGLFSRPCRKRSPFTSRGRGRLRGFLAERLHFHFPLSCIGEGNGNPLQCSCLENPRDGGAWWAAIYEALVPSRDSRARTRSPSPRAWRPDFVQNGQIHRIRKTDYCSPRVSHPFASCCG